MNGKSSVLGFAGRSSTARTNLGLGRCCADTRTRADTNTEETSMDENRVAGTAKNLGGKVEEGFGRVTGDAKTQAKGLYNQAEGAAQNLYGQAVDTAGEAAEAVRQTAVSVEDTLRNMIETKPYTSVGIALGLGWLIGRVHRPF
jgi:uncharacterized protein YjbJ (UPF0337 family)